MPESTASEDDRLPTHRPRRWLTWVLIPALLGGLVLVQARWFRESSCETFDEFTYLRMGICIFRLNDFKSMASPMTPPLPILLEYWLPALSARSLPDTANWKYEVPALIQQARFLTSVSVGLPLVWVVYAWLLVRRGWVIGAFGGGLTALSPSILAAVSIATTDACFTLFAIVSLAMLHRYQLRPSKRTLALAGVGLGLALASKQSAVVLTPVVLLELFLKRPKRTPGATEVDHWIHVVVVTGLRFSAVLAIMFMVDWSLYAFRFAPAFGEGGTQTEMPIVVPMITRYLPNGDAILEAIRRTGPPLAYDTLMGQIRHATNGHGAYLMGMHSQRGWWYFFPIAIALKSTPAELVLFALAAILAVRRSSWTDPTRRVWMASLISLLGLAMCSSINIGHRYILLAYPLVTLIAADSIADLSLRRARAAAMVGSALLAWQAVSVMGVAPHYLCYFNSFCGGPSQGYRYLLDSSLDWGQGLPALRKELEARRYHKVALMYFGTALPEAYGLRSIPYGLGNDPIAEGCDWLAISATSSQGLYGDPELSLPFDALPKRQAAYSIFYYDLNDPKVRAFLESTRTPVTPRPLNRRRIPRN